ncbi:protoporphyrinogen oxidase HemJ [Legionella sp. WA2024007413]
MLWIKAFHIIAMVSWFAGLFYLPRLFVYHADTQDEPSLIRFKTMERRLYYGIMWPAAILTTFFGLWLLSYNLSYYMSVGWMHAKLSLVIILWVYHLLCGYYLKAFSRNQNQKNSRFFRIYNEFPTLLLIGIVILVVVKP